MKIAIKTFGCRANSVDSDVLCSEALARGHELVRETDPADAYIINSCTVTRAADRDARLQVHRFKRINPESSVAVIGCYGQVAREEILEDGAVDYVLGTADKLSVLDLIEKRPKNRDQVTLPTGFLPSIFRGSQKSRAPIKIQDGCNYQCSFCIIPQARGKSRSQSEESVISQIKRAYEMGYQEVVLTGIHLALYGWDRNTNLVSLLKNIFSEPGPRVRLSTLDPFEIGEDLLELLAAEPRLCPHFHIALQSGSNEILKKMRRFYTAEEFVQVTEKIRDRRSDAFIGADVIVGFPGESDSNFAETVRCLEISPWTKLHVFPYSDRNGTRASEIVNKVATTVISGRVHRLLSMSRVRYHKFLDSQCGQSREVVVEKKETKRDMWRGHTDNYIPVLIPGKAREKELLLLELASRSGDSMIAGRVSEESSSTAPHVVGCFPAEQPQGLSA